MTLKLDEMVINNRMKENPKSAWDTNLTIQRKLPTYQSIERKNLSVPDANLMIEWKRMLKVWEIL